LQLQSLPSPEEPLPSKFLLRHKFKPHMLYCTLTRSEVNARYADLHLSGRRFQTKLYQKWKAAMLKRKKELLF
jgi:hypothetical protein